MFGVYLHIVTPIKLNFCFIVSFLSLWIQRNLKRRRCSLLSPSLHQYQRQITDSQHISPSNIFYIYLEPTIYSFVRKCHSSSQYLKASFFHIHFRKLQLLLRQSDASVLASSSFDNFNS